MAFVTHAPDTTLASVGMARSQNGHPVQQQPVLVIPWEDDVTDAKGWLVLDATTNGVSGGGIFMRRGATQQEVADIAFNMTRKFTVTAPQIGGAKAGIDFDHTDPRAKDVLRRFINYNSIMLKSVWVTAGDLNTDDAFIEAVIQEDVGLPTCQATLGRKFAAATGQPDLSAALATIIAAPATPYFPLIEAAVGSGVATAVGVAKRHAGLSDTVINVVIQGFGAVGSSLAFYLTSRGIAKVVAIADADGYVCDDAGLDVEAILAARHTVVEAAKAAGDAARAAALAKSLVPAMQAAGDASPVAVVSGRVTLTQLWAAPSVEVHAVCPCAVRYVVDVDAVAAVFRRTDDAGAAKPPARILVCGANNPYGVLQPDGRVAEDKTGTVYRALIDAHTVVVPDWVSNSGTAQLFHRSLSVQFLTAPGAAVPVDDILAACDAPIVSFLDDAFRLYADGQPHLLAHACAVLAGKRMGCPTPFAAAGGAASALSTSVYAYPPAPGLPPPGDRLADLLALRDVLGCELVGADELDLTLRTVANPVAYDGFEPSGRMHIAQGLLKTLIVNRFVRNGFTFVLWVADWFAQLNLKMGGNLEDIQVLGQYFVEVWSSCGMDTSRVRFAWAKDEILGRSEEYWSTVINLMTKVSLNRIKKCTQIMGRKNDAGLKASQMLYPAMQCADIAFLGVDVCQLGLDQRKVNMLAREEFHTMGMAKPPAVLSHPMLPGLKKGQAKMSKSDPDTALWMEDTAEDVTRKVGKAHCPPPEEGVDDNPVLAYLKAIVFPFAAERGAAKVDVKDSRTGDATASFTTYAELEAAYVAGRIHPADLKACLAEQLNVLLEPTRRHFATNPTAGALRRRVVSLMEADRARRAAAGAGAGAGGK